MPFLGVFCRPCLWRFSTHALTIFCNLINFSQKMAPYEEPCQKLNGAISLGCNLFRPLALDSILAHTARVHSSDETWFSMPLPCHFLEFATELYLHSPKPLWPVATWLFTIGWALLGGIISEFKCVLDTACNLFRPLGSRYSSLSSRLHCCHSFFGVLLQTMLACVYVDS